MLFSMVCGSHLLVVDTRGVAEAFVADVECVIPQALLQV